MPFRVVQPPTNQEEFAELGKRLFAAAQALNVPLDPEGFLYSWVNGTRVVIEEVDDEIKGFAMLAAGKRWTHNDTTATVLVRESRGDEDGLLEFLKQIAAALPCAPDHANPQKPEKREEIGAGGGKPNGAVRDKPEARRSGLRLQQK